jgi:hypothetical protein
MIGRLSALAVAAPLLAALFGCSELPAIPEGECGNLVVETGEDCDGFDTQGTACRAPGSTGECHWSCRRDSPQPNACPAGFGCDADGVCRKPRAEFAAVAEAIPGNAEALLAGDFDGDGKDDVVGTEPALAFGITKLRLHYFDERAQPSHSWASTKPIVSPSIRDLTGDGRSDVAFSNGDLAVMSGSADGVLIPHSYPSYFLASEARMLLVSEREIDGWTPLVVFADRMGTLGLHRIEPVTASFVPIVEVGRPVAELVADPAIGTIFDAENSGCFEIVLAFQGDRSFSVVSACERDPVTGIAHWLKKARVREVALEPGVELTKGLLLSDLNRDGHLDVMVGTEVGPFVSFGDGNELATAAPYPILAASDDPNVPVDLALMPLAAADLNADGEPDFVFPEALAFSYADPVTGEVLVQGTHQKYGKPWTEAVVADLNGNGLLDVAAISRESLDIDVFNGSGKSLTRFVISTDRPNQHLSVGDFDGDFVNDLVFVERELLSGEPDYLSIAFGNPSGPPGAPVTAARLDGIVQTSPFRNELDAPIDHLILSYTQSNADSLEGTAIGIFVGSGDRFLDSPIELSTFALMGSLESAVAYTAATGTLTSPKAIDFVAIAALATPEGPGRRSVWVVPDVASGRATSRELGWPFDADLQHYSEQFLGDALLSMHLVLGDIDGDGLDEVVVSAPNAARHCVVTAGRLDASGAQLERVGRVELDEACGAGSELQLLELDGQPGAEMVVLTGERQGPRQLVAVSWSGGDFVAEALTPAGDEPVPQAFTLYRSTPEAEPTLAYVTDTGLFLRPIVRGAHPLGEPRRVGELSRGTGVVAADVNGDGVRDLAVADRGQVRIWRALLEDQ